MPYRDKTLLFDFDGTISLGSGPVLAYARSAAAELPRAEAAAFIETVRVTLDAHPSGRVPGSAAIDGYDLVRVLSAEHGIRPDSLGPAYLVSREHLASPLAPVVAPAGLAAFLAGAKGRANLVVATNAPETRIEAALDILGLGGLFDAVYTSLSKPVGLTTVLDEWMPRGQLLSIGDVWANDLAPAHARGALTALVGPPVESEEFAPTFRGDDLYTLYPVIEDWLDSFHPSSLSTTTERQIK